MFFIYNTYEDRSIHEIVKRQVNHDAVFNSKFTSGNNFSYKLALIEKIKPQIISLGSSRVMQFREELFKTSFVNAGGGMNHLNEGYLFLKEMIKFHKPEYIILGLDFWWFNSNFNQPETFPNHSLNGDTDFKQKVITIFHLIKDGKVDLDTFFYGLFSFKNKITNFENIGINAIDYSNGFRKDGSYFYSQFIFGETNNHDINFSNTFKRIDNGNSRFEYSEHVSQERVKIFNDIVNFSKINDIKIVVFIPPLPKEVLNKMDSLGIKYNFVEEFRQIVKNSDIENYDYHDMKNFLDNSCEFIDGFHGGDVIYQRILKDMHNKNSILKKYINIEQINLSIKKNEGKVLSIFDESKYKLKKEIDFLEIGCTK
ncbi:hypothetical protein [Aliarcobacter cryaerophilus]|uniref:hypothetical protein n=1 Tax=Aliarcobacter cryaerophilus TaxID=28198 RepID=UPI003DA27EB5